MRRERLPPQVMLGGRGLTAAERCSQCPGHSCTSEIMCARVGAESVILKIPG